MPHSGFPQLLYAWMQCCQPGMGIFPQIRGIHTSDGEFQFGFWGILAPELKFQKKQTYGNGEFLKFFEF